MPQIATVVYCLGIIALFLLDRDQKARTSAGLLLPIAWLLINASRPVSAWLGITPPSAPEQYLEGSPLDASVYLLMLCTGLAVLLGRQARVVALLRANPAILCFIAYCGVSSIWSEHPMVSFKRWIKLLSDLVMVLIVLSEADWRWAVRRLFAAVGFILVPTSILMIKYYPDLARYYSRWEGRMFVSGVAQDKNMLGMTCLVVGLATIWRLLSIYQDSHGGKGRAKGFAAHGLLFLMIVWLLWQANSMTSISCLAMAGGLIAATTLFKFARKPSNIHVLLAAVVLTSSSVLFFNVGGGALQSMGRDPTLTGRTEIWGHLISLNRNPLLGAGYESFWLGENLEKIWKMADVLNGLNETHNAYLEIYLSLGWIGVILLAAMLVLGYRNVMAVLNTDPTFGNLAVGIFAAAIVYGFTESAAFKMMSPVWICFLIAILLPRTAQKRVSAEMQVLRPSRQREWFDPIGSIPTGS